MARKCRNVVAAGALPGSDNYHAVPIRLTETQKARFCPQKAIACGTFACVYESPDPTKVVKFTSDLGDIWGLERSGGRHTPRVLSRPVKLKINSGQIYSRSVYASEIEKVTPISKKEWEQFNDVTTIADDLTYLAGGSQQRKEEILPGFLRKCKTNYCRETLKEIANVVVDLWERGIRAGDTHPGNFGRRADGSLVMLDLGGSTMFGAPKYETLAGRRKRRRKTNRSSSKKSS